MIKKMSDDDLKRIFEEVRNIKLSEWNCKEEKTPTRNVTQLSERMTYFPVNKWLIGRSLIQEFRSRDQNFLGSSVMGCLRPLASRRQRTESGRGQTGCLSVVRIFLTDLSAVWILSVFSARVFPVSILSAVRILSGFYEKSCPLSVYPVGQGRTRAVRKI